MIEVRYENQLGNNLFQYCMGRILAEELGFYLKPCNIEGFPFTADLVEGVRFDKGHFKTVGCCAEYGGMNDETVDLNIILANEGYRKVIVSGFFQRYEHFRWCKHRVKKWLYQQIETSQKKEDLIIHVRLGDYSILHNEVDVIYKDGVKRGGHLVDYGYYLDAIKESGSQNITIVTDEPSHPFIHKLKDKIVENCSVISGSMMEDFLLIRSFNKICISKSTFAWWAAFLSEAREIYMPRTPWGVWSSDNTSLYVEDESRYRVLDASNLGDI